MRVVIMPRVDEAQQNGRIAEWLKKEGDEIKENDLIADAMTEKIMFDIVAPISGTLYRIFVEEETDVPIGTSIALIVEPSDNEQTVNETIERIEREQSNVQKAED